MVKVSYIYGVSRLLLAVRKQAKLDDAWDEWRMSACREILKSIMYILYHEKNKPPIVKKRGYL